MKSILALITSAGLALWAAGPVQAAPIHLDITIDFSLTKVSHLCSDAVGGQAEPGDGNCNYYQPLALDQTYIGSMLFSGQFNEIAYGMYTFVSGTVSCAFAGMSCYTSGYASDTVFGQDVIRFTPFNSSLSASFAFDRTDGTGWHTWADDGVPFESRGRFEFSDVQVTGLPTTMPLSASVLFLAAGLGALAVVRKRS